MGAIRKERILDTFAAHKEHSVEYGSKTDTLKKYMLNSENSIDTVRKERILRQLVQNESLIPNQVFILCKFTNERVIYEYANGNKDSLFIQRHQL